MRKFDLRYLVLWLFLFGIIIIVFLQVISGYNIRRLSEGNRNVLKELRVQKDLHELQSSVLTVESDVRGAVITGNRDHLDNLGSNVLHIDEQLKALRNNAQSFDANNLDKLEALVHEKNIFNQKVLDTFYVKNLRRNN